MKVFVGSITHCEDIQEAILAITEITYTYEGKQGLNMVFACEEPNEKRAVRVIKDKLKTLPQLGGVFYNVTVGY